MGWRAKSGEGSSTAIVIDWSRQTVDAATAGARRLGNGSGQSRLIGAGTLLAASDAGVEVFRLRPELEIWFNVSLLKLTEEE